MPARWAYLSEACTLRDGFFPGDPGEAAYLTAQGALGWELVTVLRTPGLQPHREVLVYYWKRRLD
jgi:hypothetical protein